MTSHREVHEFTLPTATSLRCAKVHLSLTAASAAMSCRVIQGGLTGPRASSWDDRHTSFGKWCGRCLPWLHHKGALPIDPARNTIMLCFALFACSLASWSWCYAHACLLLSWNVREIWPVGKPLRYGRWTCNASTRIPLDTRRGLMSCSFPISIRTTQTGLSHTCHGTFPNYLDVSQWSNPTSPAWHL